MKKIRSDQILELLKENGTVNVAELSEIFQVSTKTISRDLHILEAKGELLRTHGGAQLIKGDILREKPLELRLNIELEKKQEIGLLATTLIKNGHKIFIGAGSSLYHFTARIDNSKRLYVVTDSVSVVNQLNNRSEIDIFLIGGEVTKHTLGTSGTIAENNLKNFYFDLAFMSATTIDMDGNLFHRGPAEYGIYRHLSAHSNKQVVLMDSKKLGKKDFIKVASMRSGDILVTDSQGDTDILDQYKEKGFVVKIVN